MKLKAGLEIHQQLNSGKLFCNCDSNESGKDLLFKRKLHATSSELGEIDIAAKTEQKKLCKKLAITDKQLTSKEEERVLRAEHAKLGKRVQQITTSLTTFFKWKIHCKHPIGFAMGGKTLYVGGNGTVQAFDATDGKELWSGKIEGRGYGLAISNGRLLVSTDRGYIHCFK